MNFHVSRALVVALATAASAGLTQYATSNGEYATVAGALAAAISAGILYNPSKPEPPAP